MPSLGGVNAPDGAATVYVAVSVAAFPVVGLTLTPVTISSPLRPFTVFFPLLLLLASIVSTLPAVAAYTTVTFTDDVPASGHVARSGDGCGGGRRPRGRDFDRERP